MRFKDFQIGLYRYYKLYSEDNDILSMDAFFIMVKDYKERDDKYVVYFGYSRRDTAKKHILYIGTTIQYPLSRFYYHSQHGKNLHFDIKFRFDNEQDMLNKEYEMIRKYHPEMNKIIDRPQNFNVPLSEETLRSRIGDPQWCQCCLKRRVSPGYKYCYFCSRIAMGD